MHEGRAYERGYLASYIIEDHLWLLYFGVTVKKKEGYMCCLPECPKDSSVSYPSFNAATNSSTRPGAVIKINVPQRLYHKNLCKNTETCQVPPDPS